MASCLKKQKLHVSISSRHLNVIQCTFAFSLKMHTRLSLNDNVLRSVIRKLVFHVAKLKGGWCSFSMISNSKLMAFFRSESLFYIIFLKVQKPPMSQRLAICFSPTWFTIRAEGFLWHDDDSVSGWRFVDDTVVTAWGCIITPVILARKRFA